MSEQKSELRAAFRERRKSLSQTEREAANSALFLALQELAADLQHIAVYDSTDSEISVAEFAQWALDDGRHIYYPRTLEGAGEMAFVEVSDHGELQPGRFGIREPNGVSAAPQLFQLILVPAVAFDRHGSRLGFGGGYYDRYLPKTKAMFVGVGYHWQIVDSLPREEHDILMHFVVTDQSVIECT